MPVLARLERLGDGLQMPPAETALPFQNEAKLYAGGGFHAAAAAGTEKAVPKGDFAGNRFKEFQPPAPRAPNASVGGGVLRRAPAGMAHMRPPPEEHRAGKGGCRNLFTCAMLPAPCQFWEGVRRLRFLHYKF